MLLTRVHERLLPTALARLTDTTPIRGPLRTAANAYQAAIDNLNQAGRPHRMTTDHVQNLTQKRGSAAPSSTRG